MQTNVYITRLKLIFLFLNIFFCNRYSSLYLNAISEKNKSLLKIINIRLITKISVCIIFIVELCCCHNFLFKVTSINKSNVHNIFNVNICILYIS